MIGSHDPSIFNAESDLYKRTDAYARALGHLVLIDTTTRQNAFKPFHTATFSVYGTNSWSRLLAPFDAIRIGKRLGAELVTTQDPFEHGFAGTRIAHALHVPLHVQLHTDPFSPLFTRGSLANRIRLRLMKYVIARAARIRVVSRHLAHAVAAQYHPRAPVHVLPIFTDLTRFRAITRAPQQGQLLWVGRFEGEKDPMLALDTLAAARAAGIDARLTMLGAGRLQEAVRASAEAKEIAAYLELPGRVDPAPYLARAELVLATSWYEGYGLAILEALAAGVPVLSTEVGIAKEAGAQTAPRALFAGEAVSLLQHGPPAPPPVTDPYASFEAYVEAYAKDIRATITG